MTATRPNTPAPATPPIRAVSLSWSESVEIKQVNTFQKSMQGFQTYFKARGPERGDKEASVSAKDRLCQKTGQAFTLSAVQAFNFLQQKQSRMSGYQTPFAVDKSVKQNLWKKNSWYPVLFSLITTIREVMAVSASNFINGWQIRSVRNRISLIPLRAFNFT